ncbi:hypothetical protein BU24DRAFT_439393 [Aaosphaeria arxii CBS 175.79]|uniref:ubiquitinyl hydrolase 1 n=1 Tax=Aaosphaeria arxii CBS 175.79 TaxID=1450172 RepID=A0A6A5Y1E1_9PLEO|nr:uncharacterized protein BU24DRAFT_439393 [Aaosphaeria arxii CBS 175.79]KAF2019066.1 hypothetical protein BU24DRAFT_439393 [Aaosphaeria arxii CBS 175.79]
MATEKPRKLSAAALNYLIHHAVLPPKLPQGSDRSENEHEQALFDVLLQALSTFRGHLDSPQDQLQIHSTYNMVRSCKSLREGSGNVNEARLRLAITQLKSDNDIHLIPIEVKSQNAGLLVRRYADTIEFHTFELSPADKAVTSTSGRLRRSFPARASQVSLNQICDPDLAAALAHTVSTLCSQFVPSLTWKAELTGDQPEKDMDINRSGLVTHYHSALISALGKPVESSLIWKNTHQEVLSLDSRSTWRRSSLYLLLRVSMQLNLSIFSIRSGGSALYKPVTCFFLSKTLRLALDPKNSVDCEVIYAVLMKLSRRLQKLLPSFLAAQQYLDKKWQSIRRDCSLSIDILSLRDLRPHKDVLVNLPDLERFIGSLDLGKGTANIASFHPPTSLVQFAACQLPSNIDASSDSLYFNLAAVEMWVERELCSWIQSNWGATDTCRRLFDLTLRYFTLCQKAYASNPSSLSIMYLTILDLWIAIDKSACHLYPLLEKYTPEIPLEPLRALLLPLKQQLHRLAYAEVYIKTRIKVGRPRYQPWRNFGQRASCFAAQYFEESVELQSLYGSILEDENRQREAKVIELVSKQEEYRALILEYECMDCTYTKEERFEPTTSEYITERGHDPSCEKCRCKAKADDITIEFFEAPLPSNETKAKCVIFEMQVPEAFQAWRSATVFLHRDVLGYNYKAGTNCKSPCTLHSDPSLSRFVTFEVYSNDRIVLASATRPRSASQEGNKASGDSILSLSKEDICFESGLEYEYFDSKDQVFTVDYNSTDHLSDQCLYQLPHRSIQLQQFLARTSSNPDGVPPNNVIATQSKTLEHILPDEYRAFGTIPLGGNLQYSNILTQLSMPALDFAKEEAQLLIMQTIHQAGCPSMQDSPERINHLQLTDRRCALDQVKENWESWRSVASFVQLTNRLISCCDSAEVMQSCLTFLREGSLSTPIDEEESKTFMKLIEIGLVGTSTFDIGQPELKTVLFDPAECAIFLQCSMTIQRNKASKSSCSSALHDIMIQSWQKLMFRALPIAQNVCCSTTALDSAISVTWHQFSAKGTWKVLSSQQQHWLSNTASTSFGSSTTVLIHFNLLTAELLVNGVPFSKLPVDYRTHPTYKLLFNSTSLDVVPSISPEFSFSTIRSYHDYQIHFEKEGSSLSMKLEIENRSFHLLPSRLFHQNFPNTFLTNYIHWYDKQANVVYFCHRDSPWPSEQSRSWCLNKLDSQWSLSKAGRKMLAHTSDTTRRLCNLLSGFEEKSHIHTLFNADTHTIDVELPRLQLSFFYRGLAVDPCQRLETLVGLTTKLVLKEGTVTYSRTDSHVSVSITLGPGGHTHAYHVDESIGRLLDDGSLHSKIYLCYLHALTSYCLPDPLTGHTGTEAALEILRSGSVRSFERLSRSKTTHMQKIIWDENLPCLSQNSLFYTHVSTILNIERQRRSLCQQATSGEIPSLKFAQKDLIQRDLWRTAMFHVYASSEEQRSFSADTFYDGSQTDGNIRSEERSYHAASLILGEKCGSDRKLSTEARADFISRYFNDATIQGHKRSINSSELRYDARWLEDITEWIRMNCFNKYGMAMWLSSIAFGVETDEDTIRILALLYRSSRIQAIKVPRAAKFEMPKGTEADLDTLVSHLKGAAEPFSEARWPVRRKPHEVEKNYRKRRTRLYRNAQNRSIAALAEFFLALWPSPSVQIPAEHEARKFLDANRAILIVQSLFQKWSDNSRLSQYLDDVLTAAEEEPVIELRSFDVPKSPNKSVLTDQTRRICVADIFRSDPCELELPPQLRKVGMKYHNDSVELHVQKHFSSLCKALEVRAESDSEREFVSCLVQGFTSLHNNRYEIAHMSSSDIESMLRRYLNDCERYTTHLYNDMARTVSCSLHSKAYFLGLQSTWTPTKLSELYRPLLPRISPALFLRQLNRDNWHRLSKNWQSVIVQYGLALTEYNRAVRMLGLVRDPVDLVQELRNPGHENWNPMKQPENLLLEVESGITIRPVQEEIAMHMREPETGQNTIMQLNMGEGKSSVITPLVALSVADGTKLARVVVARPQSKQMFEMLVCKVGGLLNRRVYHTSFSRALKLDKGQVRLVQEILQDCIENRGILLMQPEHILSFKLMGLECLLSDKTEIGEALIGVQHFLNEQSRDIVDESDENFGVYFELIYTVGAPAPIEFSPERWSVLQEVMTMVAACAHEVKMTLPLSIDVDSRHIERFPHIRILKQDANYMLMKKVAVRIRTTNFTGLHITRQSEAVRNAVYNYITEQDVSEDDVSAVENDGMWTESMRTILLLLRGLFAGGILPFALGNKRWKVQYGLDPALDPRAKVAVPYRSKDKPSPRSEFSHPDVLILLTLLSYYYGGLDDKRLTLAFEHLFKSDQADSEYAAWIDGATANMLPREYHRIGNINLRDSLRCTRQLFPGLRFSKGAIDYYLKHIVFPKELKEYPHKLSASGWDIGQGKAHPLTGFSGTNDSRHTLPLMIKYLDIDQQKHTNALNLANLLQGTNSVALIPPRPTMVQSDAEHLLDFITSMTPAVRVILDVGAQILELDNLEVAKRWIEMSGLSDAQAVIFFNENDQLCVCDRRGRVEELQTSTYARHSELCLVYLDEAHTRGTDLKLPRNYRAAVTLGAGLTKDKLAQACMRMRKLGKGQSVAYCVPEEIRIKILEKLDKAQESQISVSDVLCWTILETWTDLRRSMRLWAAQGQRFYHQQSILDVETITKEVVEKLLEKEAASLEYRYKPLTLTQLQERQFEGWDLDDDDISKIVKRCRKFGAMNVSLMDLQEEQERELYPEIEAEREVEEVLQITEANHRLDRNIGNLVRTGRLKATPTIIPAFETLKGTSIAKEFNIPKFPGGLYVTSDYARTVKLPTRSYSDLYHRPIQWIISVPDHHDTSTIQGLVIISPFEANCLYPYIQSHDKVTLHLYSPRQNPSYRPLDRLDLYNVGREFDPDSVPRSMTLQLNLFAGQLYLRSYEEYVELCDHLGLAHAAAEYDQELSPDGFITNSTGHWGFTKSPVGFLKGLFTKIRRDCRGIDKSHMGFILEGAHLEEDDFPPVDDVNVDDNVEVEAEARVKVENMDIDDEDSLFVRLAG